MTTSTTIEQSKRLLELGLDPSTADMVYISGAPPHLNVLDEEYIKREMLDEYDVLAWSLSALLEVMPLGVELHKMRDDAGKAYYEIDYLYTGYEDSDPINAAYEMACWLLENGHIKKGGDHGI